MERGRGRWEGKIGSMGGNKGVEEKNKERKGKRRRERKRERKKEREEREKMGNGGKMKRGNGENRGEMRKVKGEWGTRGGMGK